VSRDVAVAVATEAMRTNLAEPITPAELEARIDAQIWEPRYVPYRH
jgi:malate dehydrogenase (oxaloacetate-decarboxylating)